MPVFSLYYRGCSGACFDLRYTGFEHTNPRSFIYFSCLLLTNDLADHGVSSRAPLSSLAISSLCNATVSLSMNDILDIGGDGAARERERRSNSLNSGVVQFLREFYSKIAHVRQPSPPYRPHLLSASSVSCLASALWMIHIQKAVTRPWIELTVSR